MRTHYLVPILIAVSLHAYSAEPDANARLAESARTLDWRAHQSLGIGIRQVALLLQADPRGVFRKDTLVGNGTWQLLQELESKGFVTTRESAMPDGSVVGNLAVSFSATAKGQAIVMAIRGK